MTEVPSFPDEIDASVAHMARIYDYLLGGSTNFHVDREVAERVCAALPGGIETAKKNIRANREFLVRAVRSLVLEKGARQFLDIGTGIPNEDNVHGVAQDAAPECRIVYVDHDPIVVAHADELLRSTGEGAAAFITGDLRDPHSILLRAAATLDFDEPVVVMMVGVLHYIADHEDPYAIVQQVLDAVPSGSYLVVSHLASDVQSEMEELADRHNDQSAQETAEEVALRSHAEIERFFQGLDLLPPGLVPLNRWLTMEPTGSDIPIYGAVAKKP